MYRIHFTLSLLFLLLTGFTSIADELPDTCLIDTEATAIEAMTADVDTTVQRTDSVKAEGVDTISSQLEGTMCCLTMFGPSYYRQYQGPDFHFFKNTTNYSIKPYTFMQDQTWVGIPVFAAGWIIKGEKEAFRQNYNNPNTKIRLIKYNFHSEIDNYTQFAGIGMTVALKLALPSIMPFVVSASSRSPGICLILAQRSTIPRLTSGSPPVIRTLVTPSSTAASVISTSSSKVRISPWGFFGTPSLGMQ